LVLQASSLHRGQILYLLIGQRHQQGNDSVSQGYRHGYGSPVLE